MRPNLMLGVTVWLIVCSGVARQADCAELAADANPELLVDQPQFMRLLLSDDHAVVPIDVRPRQEFDQAHLPTAKHVDAGDWKAAFGDGTDVGAWSKRIGDLGIGAGVTVVVYDRFTSPAATRVWWILKYWGVDDVRLLDGGFRDPQPPTPAKALAPRPPTEFVATPQAERLATRDEVMAAVSGDSAARACVVDTRSRAEVAAGAIPTASHSEWTRYVDPATGKLRPADELRRLLDEAGVDAGKPVVTYCRTGGRASLVAFVAELMGAGEVANYHGSWNDWSRGPGSPASPLPAAPVGVGR